MENRGAEQPERGPKTYSPEEVRQAQIILRKPWERMVFFAGLAGAVLLALVAMVVSFAR